MENISNFKSLPNDLIEAILSEAGANDTLDYLNCILTCKEVKACGGSKIIFQKMNIDFLVEQPLTSYNRQELLQICLANDHPKAHYIKGLLTYFHEGLNPLLAYTI
ncbi:unnamed protein product [Cochlearia groenlandica]